jgi:hypothetical protein
MKPDRANFSSLLHRGKISAARCNLSRCLGAGSKKIFALKLFERLVVRLPTPAFRCIQKNLPRHDLANDLSEPRSAVHLPLCLSGIALLRWKTATQTELKSNRHTSVIDAA